MCVVTEFKPSKFFGAPSSFVFAPNESQSNFLESRPRIDRWSSHDYNCCNLRVVVVLTLFYNKDFQNVNRCWVRTSSRPRMLLMQTPDLRDLEPICGQDYAAEPASDKPSADRSKSKSWPATRDPIPELESYDAPVHNLGSVAPILPIACGWK